MESTRKTAVAIGILLLAGMLFGAFSSVPALEKPDYMETVASLETPVLIAVLCQFGMATAYLVLTVLFFPFVKLHSEKRALAYFGFRLIGVSFLFVGMVTLLMLLFISRAYLTSESAAQSSVIIVGELIRVSRDWLNHAGFILSWSIGGLLLYSSLLKTKVIPAWLSIWGVGGTLLTLVATFLYVLGMLPIATPLYFLLNTPTALFELTLAIYLMVRGFAPSSTPE